LNRVSEKNKVKHSGMRGIALVKTKTGGYGKKKKIEGHTHGVGKGSETLGDWGSQRGKRREEGWPKGKGTPEKNLRLKRTKSKKNPAAIVWEDAKKRN